jgi:hypothetical protein
LAQRAFATDHRVRRFPLLEKTKTHHDLYYGGRREKEQFVAYLNGRLRDKRLPGGVQSRIARRRRGAPGTLHKSAENGYTRKSFDITTALLDVLGKPVSEVPENYERGEFLVDTGMDLETNASKGLTREHSLMLQPGPAPETSVVRIAQTFRSGANDIDETIF